MKVKQYHGWVSTGAGSIFVSEFLPSIGSSKGSVVVAPPFGPEYMHCKATVRRLCFELAESGFSVLSFDWPGYGNSTGQLPTSKWVQGAQTCLQDLIKTVNERGDTTSLICLRSASLPAVSAINSLELNHLFFWYPYGQGKALIRDFQLIDRALAVPPDNDILTAGGYPLLAEDISQIEAISLSNLLPFQCNSAFTIHSPEAKRLAFKNAFSDKGIHFTAKVSTELRLMIRQAELSQPADTDIRCIVQTLLKDSNKNGYLDPLSNRRIVTADWQESVLSYGENDQGFAILTKPIRVPSSKECLIIPNTGSGHHCGPNGIHTRLARSLAACGTSTIRMDLNHLGNSGLTSNDNSTEAYCLHAVEDIKNIQIQLKGAGYKQASLFGICAGAHSCFQYLTSSTRILNLNRVCLVNANTLYWTPDRNAWQPEKDSDDHVAHYHRRQAGNIKAWGNLIRTPSKWPRIFRVAAIRILTSLRRITVLSSRETNKFTDDCQSILNSAQELRFVFSPDEPGMRILESKGGTAFDKLRRDNNFHWLQLANGDHTFTMEPDREELINTVRAMFKQSTVKKDHREPAATVPAIVDNHTS